MGTKMQNSNFVPVSDISDSGTKMQNSNFVPICLQAQAQILTYFKFMQIGEDSVPRIYLAYTSIARNCHDQCK